MPGVVALVVGAIVGVIDFADVDVMERADVGAVARSEPVGVGTLVDARMLAIVVERVDGAELVELVERVDGAEPRELSCRAIAPMNVAMTSPTAMANPICAALGQPPARRCDPPRSSTGRRGTCARLRARHCYSQPTPLWTMSRLLLFGVAATRATSAHLTRVRLGAGGAPGTLVPFSEFSPFMMDGMPEFLRSAQANAR